MDLHKQAYSAFCWSEQGESSRLMALVTGVCDGWHVTHYTRHITHNA